MTPLNTKPLLRFVALLPLLLAALAPCSVAMAAPEAPANHSTPDPSIVSNQTQSFAHKLCFWNRWRTSPTQLLWATSRKAPTYAIANSQGTSAVVATALDMFAQDLQMVTTQHPHEVAKLKKATIVITQWDRATDAERAQLSACSIDTAHLASLTDGFVLKVCNGQIHVVGSNGRGTAYGILELSRLAGVDPWVWWADLLPQRQDTLALPLNFASVHGAGVEWRGIFINDEDWSLLPWSSKTYEPEAQETPQTSTNKRKATIGPRTYKRVCQLLMRLRANALWPAMHESTNPFFFTTGAKAVADSCGIAIGTSHCEPLLRNNTGEWDRATMGDYNFLSNRQNVLNYWAQRLTEVRNSEGGNMLTIGMRGIHDGSMEGTNKMTIEGKRDALQQVIDAQQLLIDSILGNPEDQMQVFVPYKEVLQIYEAGLRLPDNVTLMWCDDNYGYLTRLSTPSEQSRKGGAGLYYHLSYWGRPHDYLWLGTTQPGLIVNELTEALHHGMTKLWIFNIHDPRAAAYNLELALDMAWDTTCVSPTSVQAHMTQWLCRLFGPEVGNSLSPTLCEFYRLCALRRPEHCGWNQVELSKQKYPRGLSPVSDSNLPIGNGMLNLRLDQWHQVRQVVESCQTRVRPEAQAAFFSLVGYPVMASEAHVRKLLEAQRARFLWNDTITRPFAEARHLANVSAALSLKAYNEVQQLTASLDTLCGGKWRGLMCANPRDLPVFRMAPLPCPITMEMADSLLAQTVAAVMSSDSVSLYPFTPSSEVATYAILPPDTSFANPKLLFALPAADLIHSAGTEVQLLGHTSRAVSLPKGETLSLTFNFDGLASSDTTIHTSSVRAKVIVSLVPTHPVDQADMALMVDLDGVETNFFLLREPFRSEAWKEHVLNNEMVCQLPIVNLSKGSHTITIKAMDPHIVIDWVGVAVQTN